MNPDLLPKAGIIMDVIADTDGFVSSIDAKSIGKASLVLGGGRETKESDIDYSVGVVLKKKVADRVERGDCIAIIHANDKEQLKIAKNLVREAYRFSKTPVPKQKLIKWVVTKEGITKI